MFYVFMCLVIVFCSPVISNKIWMTTDELENHISAEDLREFMKMSYNFSTTTAEPREDYASPNEEVTRRSIPSVVDCFGVGYSTLAWLFNMRPDHSEKVNTHFFFSSRNQPFRVQVQGGDQFGLEWVDFKPNRKTVMIVHGFMSHSNASWVHDMTRAFLSWADVNVIAVDWSGGGNTWKYWRAVANTRRVGSDITGFFKQLIQATGANRKDFHFVGHSLGAHICSYVSYHLGGVARITGLDPAQPCFRTSDRTERLDDSDADFVDVIHTNGRLLNKIGFGLPDPTGHADFYPNGGMKQPGCYNNTKHSIWYSLMPISPTKLQQAICSHGRAYLLFTESLINNNCSFRAHQWNLTYEGVNSSLTAACDRRGSCSEMGIMAAGGNGLPRAKGQYFVLTTDKEPYCPTEWERRHPRPDLLHDLREGFKLDRSNDTSTVKPVPCTPAYADPLATRAAKNSGTTQSTRLFWLLVLIVSLGCLYLLLMPVVERGSDVSYTVDTRYLQWTTTVPAVTVCEDYFNSKPYHRKLVALYPDFVKPQKYDFQRHLTDLSFNKATNCRKGLCEPCGERVPCDFNWRELIERVHANCTELLSNCTLNGQEFPCCKKFHMVDSEYGPCHSFNTLQSEHSSKEPLATVNRSSGPSTLTFRVLGDVRISVHSAEELATNFLDDKLSFDVQVAGNSWNNVFYLFSLAEFYNDPMLIADDIENRGCRYPHEVLSDPFHTYRVYSYAACRTAHVTEHAYEHCHCIHPARDLSYKDKYCNYTGLSCLVDYEASKAKNTEALHDENNFIDPCLPSCVETELTTIHISKTRDLNDPGPGKKIMIQMSALPNLRLERNLLRNQLDLTVSVGGMVGLFFGASIFSLVEIIYLFFRSP